MKYSATANFNVIVACEESRPRGLYRWLRHNLNPSLRRMSTGKVIMLTSESVLAQEGTKLRELQE